MKKETINTFLKGMVKDLHPLTTPNDVLTDALNATSITYNGNEGALLNDMGNVKIKHALLKSGYVPVGMKEHGGIIYVSAYNPETGKGLLGSFPSPKLLWESEDWTVNAPKSITTTPTIDSSSIYEGYFIKNEIIKLSIFTTSEGEARVFHPGDKFIISFPIGSISNAVSAGYVSILLGVVKSDGGIEIMRTWSKDNPDSSFLYSGSIPENAFSNPSIVQVFDASSSGEMLFIINLHTLDSFNLLRNYSLNNNGNIVVTFTGEGKKDNESYKSGDGYLNLTNSNNGSESSNIDIIENNGISNTIIYPTVPFGIVKRMGRHVSIDFNKIRKNEDTFGEWRFFVTEDYLKIGWAYDFYNLDGSKELECIKMYFYKLEEGPNAAPKGVVTFLRESYNGNFEDYIDYKLIGLAYKNIYIVKIIRKFTDSDNEEIITWKMLYLSKLYNSQYNGFYNTINMIGNSPDSLEEDLLFTPVSSSEVAVKINLKADISVRSAEVKLKAPGSEETTLNASELKSLMFSTLSEGIDLEQQNDYELKVINKYLTHFTLSGELEGIDEDIIGIPNPALIDETLSKYTLKVSNPIMSKTWTESTSLANFPEITEDSEDTDYMMIVNGNEEEELPETLQLGQNHTFPDLLFKDSRILLGLASEEKTTEFESLGLQPLYSGNLTSERRKVIAPYCNIEEGLIMSGDFDDAETIYYNTTLTKSGIVVNGPDANGGYDDGGLKTASRLMGNPMTNIFTGINGDQAEIEFGNLKKQLTVKNAIGLPDNDDDEGGEVIVDLGDNYLIACWRFTDGDIRFVNLITPRNNIGIDASANWVRLDLMMRCILSQIFTVSKITGSARYITTDERFYRYEEGTSILPAILRPSAATSEYNELTKDIMVSEDNRTLTDYLVQEWGYANGKLFNGQAGETPFTNLIPVVKLQSLEELSIDIEVPNLYDLDVLLPYFFGVPYKPIDNSDQYDILKIYGLDVTKVEENAAAQGKGLTFPKANTDGTFAWKNLPECLPLENSNTLKIYRWNNDSTTSKIVEFPNFAKHFTTKAKMEQWDVLPEGEFNELYAIHDDNVNPFAIGYGTNAKIGDAPDMYYKTLYSPQISLLNDHTS